MEELIYNDKTYRILKLTEINETKSCIAEFKYEGNWHEVKNFNICKNLRENYDRRSKYNMTEECILTLFSEAIENYKDHNSYSCLSYQMDRYALTSDERDLILNEIAMKLHLNSRFFLEIYGLCGYSNYLRACGEVVDTVKKVNEDAEIDEDEGIRWKSNKRYLMDDTLDRLRYVNYPCSFEVTKRKRELQNEAFIGENKKRNQELSPEVRIEMEKVFGKGTKIVDAISGKEFIL